MSMVFCWSKSHVHLLMTVHHFNYTNARVEMLGKCEERAQFYLSWGPWMLSSFPLLRYHWYIASWLAWSTCEIGHSTLEDPQDTNTDSNPDCRLRLGRRSMAYPDYQVGMGRVSPFGLARTGDVLFGIYLCGNEQLTVYESWLWQAAWFKTLTHMRRRRRHWFFFEFQLGGFAVCSLQLQCECHDFMLLGLARSVLVWSGPG